MSAHKGDFGHVFIVAGSRGLLGAACLASEAALRTGSGLVTLGLPKSLLATAATKLTEVMTLPLPETRSGSLSRQAEIPILHFLKKADVLGLGPGLSQDPSTQSLVRSLVRKISKPCVLDADGINAFAGRSKSLTHIRASLVLTPHPGEFSRLIGISPQEIQSHRSDLARRFAVDHKLVLVLKGYRTVVAGPHGNIRLNSTGNPGMATAGCGDVLTGMIASLLGQGLSSIDAANLAVHLHGLAGDLAAKQRGLVGLIASDLLDTIPLAIRRL